MKAKVKQGEEGEANVAPIAQTSSTSVIMEIKADPNAAIDKAE